MVGNLYATRIQYAVGQGGFHVTRLYQDDRDEDPFTFVYDCGSTSKDVALDREIESFKSQSGWWHSGGRSRDGNGLVVLSHVDEDHVNGLGRLLHQDHGWSRLDSPLRAPLTILMPYLEPWDRLMQLGSSNSPSGFQFALAIDPQAAVRERARAEVVFVKPPNRELEVPTAEELSNIGGVYMPPPDDDRAISSGAVLRPWRDSPWEFIVVVPRVIAATREVFLSSLAEALDVERSELDLLLSSPDGIQGLATSHIKAVRRATKAVAGAGGPNATSLIVYSGPTEGSSVVDAHMFGHGGHHAWCCRTLPSGRAGWLHTGDAPLHRSAAFADVANSLAATRDRVSTIVLPHHGSKSGYNDRLIAEWNPGTVVACSDLRSGWDHPNRDIWTRLARSGVHTHHVTTEECTRVVNEVLVTAT